MVGVGWLYRGKEAQIERAQASLRGGWVERERGVVNLNYLLPLLCLQYLQSYSIFLININTFVSKKDKTVDFFIQKYS